MRQEGRYVGLSHSQAGRSISVYYNSLTGSFTHVGSEARRPGVVPFGMPIEGGGAVDRIRYCVRPPVRLHQHLGIPPSERAPREVCN